jgi:hypothetical protein
MEQQIDIDTMRRIIKANFPELKYVWRLKKHQCLLKLKPFNVVGNGNDVPYRLQLNQQISSN